MVTVTVVPAPDAVELLQLTDVPLEPGLERLALGDVTSGHDDAAEREEVQRTRARAGTDQQPGGHCQEQHIHDGVGRRHQTTPVRMASALDSPTSSNSQVLPTNGGTAR